MKSENGFGLSKNVREFYWLWISCIIFHTINVSSIIIFQAISRNESILIVSIASLIIEIIIQCLFIRHKFKMDYDLTYDTEKLKKFLESSSDDA